MVENTPFLDLSASILSGGERGLLGLAFPPDYATSGRFYVNFTDPDGHTVVARFMRSQQSAVADPASRFDLVWWPRRPDYIAQPFSNHNGGHLAFGPDGYLYIGLGDGGTGNDPQNIAQQNPISCSARCCASTSTCPTRSVDGLSSCRPTTRSSTACRRGAG